TACMPARPPSLGEDGGDVQLSGGRWRSSSRSGSCKRSGQEEHGGQAEHRGDRLICRPW
ncbi:hypothetical protein B296_00058704, partial [Ensete ventricosum]